jgi:DNA-binding SARP family transcriptional activator
MVEFGILGSIQLSVDGGAVDLGGTKRRGLVCRLIVDVNRVVPLDALVEDLWAGERAGSAQSTIYTYLSQLRKIVGPDRVLTRPPGYMLVAAPDEIDAERFERLVDLARSKLDSPHDTIRMLEEADRLWRGPALAEFADASWARPTAERLERARVDAFAVRIDALLSAGRAPDAARELEGLVETQPFDERFWRQLVLANYRCGRQADALRAYQRARDTLVDELGIEPSPELRALELAVLAQDASLDVSPPIRATSDDAEIASSTGTITVLLTDIEESSTLWERAPDAMAAATLRAEKLIAECVAAADGRFLKSRGEGDATFSAFLLASNGVRAANAIRDRLEAEQWPDDARLRIRIAVNTGEVYGRDDDFFGPAVNRAARLRALVAGGQVIVGASTAALVADALPEVTLVPLDVRQLKGLQRDEPAFIVASLRPADADAASSMSDLSWIPPVFADFVGRDATLSELEECLDAAEAGHGGLVLVRGEAGVGKTRLLAEFAQRAAAGGCLVMYGRCDEDSLVPFQPFVTALGPALDRMGRLDLGSLAADLAVLFPGLRGASAWPIEMLDAESRRLRLFEAIDRALRELCKQATVLLIMDDLQWADQAVLLLLRHLTRSFANRRIVVAASFRTKDLAFDERLQRTLLDARRNLPVVDVDLAGLDETDISTLLKRYLDTAGGGRAETLARRLHHETAGNSLFVTEVIRDLVPRLRAYAAIDWPGIGSSQIPVPNTVADVVAVRVSGMQSATRRLLFAAAVIGTTFDSRIAIEVAGLAEDEAVDAIEEALSRGILIENRGIDAHYSFSHAVVRRAVYERISAPRRAWYHRAVALAMEHAESHQGGTDIAAIAQHFIAGAGMGESSEAIRYACLAGIRAVEQLSYETAIDHFRQALDLMPRERTATSDRCEALLALADALNRGGDVEEAKEALLEAAAIAEGRHEPTLLANAALLFGGPLPAGTPVTDSRVTDLLHRADAALDEGDSIERALVAARLVQAEYWDIRRAERIDRCNAAVAMARRLHNPRVLATVLINRYWALDGPDDVETRLRSSLEVEQLAAELGDPELALQGGKCRLHVLLSLDAWNEASRLADELHVRALELRQPEYERLALSFEAVRAGNAGNFDEAEELANRARELLRQRGQALHAEVVRALQLFPWRWLQGRLVECSGLAERLLARDPDPDRPTWRALLAWCHAEGGRADDAAEQIERLDLGSYVRRDHDFDFWLVTLPSALAAARLRDTATATLLYDALLPYADRNGFVGQIAFLGSVEHHLGALSEALGNSDARKHYERAETRHRAMGATAYAAVSHGCLVGTR